MTFLVMLAFAAAACGTGGGNGDSDIDIAAISENRNSDSGDDDDDNDGTDERLDDEDGGSDFNQDSGSESEDEDSEREEPEEALGGAASAERISDVSAIAIASHPMLAAIGEDSYYLAEREGRVWEVKNTTTGDNENFRLVLDITDRVQLFSEQGLLGMTFSPEGDWLYLMYSENLQSSRGVGNVLLAVPVSQPYPEDLDISPLDINAAVRIMEIPQPFGNHNGGDIHFSPADGYLYIALGDGGSANDPLGSGQNLNTLLGSILRIDPQPERGTYVVPPDNPGFVRPEIWAYGTRNPWRMRFHPQTGDLWVADVGQSSVEEITVIPQGQGGLNLGWNFYEGSSLFRGPIPANFRHHEPTFQYSYGSRIEPDFQFRCSIIGGIFDPEGRYLYGDFCEQGIVRAYNPATGEGDILAATLQDDEAGGMLTFGVTTGGEILIGTENGTHKINF